LNEPEDRRRKRWTPERLVEEFELDPAEKERKVNKEDFKERKRRTGIGKQYLKLGDKLCNERSHNRGI
jgi:hypothetical protein